MLSVISERDFIYFLRTCMGLPSKQRTNRSKRERAAHFALKPITVQIDSEGKAHLPHRANKAGMYRGRTLKASTVAKAPKKAKPAAKRKTSAHRATAKYQSSAKRTARKTA